MYVSVLLYTDTRVQTCVWPFQASAYVVCVADPNHELRLYWNMVLDAEGSFKFCQQKRMLLSENAEAANFPSCKDKSDATR